MSSSTPPRERPAKVIRLDDHRAKYLAPREPTDPFLMDAEVTARILTAAIRLPEVRAEDLLVLLGRLRTSLDLYAGSDQHADKLRRYADALRDEIARR